MNYLTVATPGPGLRLHLNENTAGCSPSVLAALRAIAPTDTAFYPDYGEVTRAAERWFDVAPGWVQLTNGLDEGLHVVAQAAARGQSDAAAIIVEPAFEMYAACADAASLRAIHLPPAEDFAFPLSEILGADRRVRLINLTDPNNPTGLPIPAGAIEEIASTRKDALVLIDEAYAEFSKRSLVGEALNRHRNLIVGRTFAKAHGLAALRVGALVAHPETLAGIRRLLPPYSLNICAVRALQAAFEDRAYLERSVAESEMSRELIYAFCREKRIAYWQSEGNFVLARIGPDASEVVAEMGARGVFIRDKSQSPGCAGCVRVTAGVVEHTRKCLETLEGVLASRSR